ncbi:DUF7342 family protein [Haladaptatus caseinilyticus]|uniref:DUF7342 family protein n=1 Tax=Haladaptatus caseinilyticus TaxID=2993314 RepID=UPI00224B6D62|nr:hypothetical protein [Haladaptatus caseinilyticus]
MSNKNPRWPDGMDGAERVQHVAATRTAPRNASWIAEEADVSRDTAVKYLTRLVEQGELTAVETDAGTCYKPDGVTQFLREVRQLAENNSMDDLTAELHAIGDEIDSWQATYDVDSLDDLRRSLGNDELGGEERRERQEIVEEWEYNIEIREALQLAISLKSSLTTLGADPSVHGSSFEGLSQEG